MESQNPTSIHILLRSKILPLLQNFRNSLPSMPNCEKVPTSNKIHVTVQILRKGEKIAGKIMRKIMHNSPTPVVKPPFPLSTRVPEFWLRKALFFLFLPTACC